MPEPLSVASSPSITPSGELRDKYRVLALLGQGGMSLVHIAAAHSPGGVQKLVVLKSIRPELIRSEKVRGMFLDEARLATRLSHPNVVQTYEVVVLSGRPVIVMEYMEGQSLFSLIRKAKDHGGLPLAMYLHLLQEALLGLDYAHSLTDYDGNSLRLVHRDISPQNVFITYDGHAKILDFGIAKALNNSTQTESGELKGKIRYMAPEQMRAVTNLDGRADVFSAGIMLWEALAERRIWKDSADVDVIHAVINDGIPKVSTVNPDVNPQLEAICAKALALNASERYQSAGEMQVALEQACEELGLRASTKDVSKLMKEVFGESRAKLRKSIDGRMKNPQGRLLDLSEGSEGGFVGDLLTETESPGSTPFKTGTRPATGKRRSTAVALGLVALLGLVAVSYWRFGASALPTSASAAVAGSPVPAAALPVAPSNTVAVNFTAEPKEATLFLDGKQLPTNPYRDELPKDELQHELRVAAPGFVSQTLTVSLSGPTNLDLSLLKATASDRAPLRKPGISSKRAVGGSASKSASVAENAPPKKSAAACDPPYTIDAKGIRRMRPECL